MFESFFVLLSIITILSICIVTAVLLLLLLLDILLFLIWALGDAAADVHGSRSGLAAMKLSPSSKSFMENLYLRKALVS